MMRNLSGLAALALLGAGQTAFAAPAPAPARPAVLTPAEIVAAAPQGDWVSIAPDDLLVMDLTPAAAGPDRPDRARRVVIQLLPAPFSQGWVGNIRKLAAAHWWDGLSINRIQDNYVVQWGDADGEDQAKARALPGELRPTRQAAYAVSAPAGLAFRSGLRDAYAARVGFAAGIPVAAGPAPRRGRGAAWPLHCYGAVGVARNMPPDAGTGAELYTVIGTPPRHLDRNIAVVGRVIEGIEHLSSLPRGTGPLGFYVTPAERTGIVSIRLGSAVADLPRYQYLSTKSASFERYVDARANRRDAFFIRPAGGVDICNLPVPVRRAP